VENWQKNDEDPEKLEGHESLQIEGAEILDLCDMNWDVAIDSGIL